MPESRYICRGPVDIERQSIGSRVIDRIDSDILFTGETDGNRGCYAGYYIDLTVFEGNTRLSGLVIVLMTNTGNVRYSPVVVFIGFQLEIPGFCPFEDEWPCANIGGVLIVLGIADILPDVLWRDGNTRCPGDLVEESRIGCLKGKNRCMVVRAVNGLDISQYIPHGKIVGFHVVVGEFYIRAGEKYTIVPVVFCR